MDVCNVFRRILSLMIIFAFLAATPVMANDLDSIPPIKEPLDVETVEKDPTIRWNERFHYKGEITGISSTKIWVNHRPFDKDDEIVYFTGEGKTTFFTAFRTGMPVALVFNSEVKIIEVWELLPH